MASGKDGGPSVGRLTLMRKLAGEIMTGEPAENYNNADMERGKRLEPEIRDWYARSRFAEVERVGFVFNPELNAGCSPDGLIGADGMLELKSAAPHVIIGILEKGTMPPEHRAQCHGGMWACRRKWLDLVIYSHPRMPKWVARVERDEVYCAEIAREVERFNWELGSLVKKIRGMG
jgi:hypothetical protein